jgi:hypothetical protein
MLKAIVAAIEGPAARLTGAAASVKADFLFKAVSPATRAWCAGEL